MPDCTPFLKMDLYTPMMKTPPTKIFVTCNDLDATVAMYTQQFGMRMDMIMPADAPRIAVVSDLGVSVRIETRENADNAHESAVPAHATNQLLITCAGDEDAWIPGRAGMQYRDLIPGRLGGRFIASHIRIPRGGPVPDYVHYHNVAFQAIYCRRGWVRVVYEDQGPPFVMHAGDCVLQPPKIRHRVLDSSSGLEVIEIGGPAEHETWREHAFDLPTPILQPARDFSGQHFVHHDASIAKWQILANSDFEYRDTGIAKSTNGVGSLRVLRTTTSHGTGEARTPTQIHNGNLLFFYVLEGRMRLHSEQLGAHTLGVDDACAIPTGVDYRISANTPCEVLEVALPAR